MDDVKTLSKLFLGVRDLCVRDHRIISCTHDTHQAMEVALNAIVQQCWQQNMQWMQRRNAYIHKTYGNDASSQIVERNRRACQMHMYFGSDQAPFRIRIIKLTAYKCTLEIVGPVNAHMMMRWRQALLLVVPAISIDTVTIEENSTALEDYVLTERLSHIVLAEQTVGNVDRMAFPSAREFGTPVAESVTSALGRYNNASRALVRHAVTSESTSVFHLDGRRQSSPNHAQHHVIDQIRQDHTFVRFETPQVVCKSTPAANVQSSSTHGTQSPFWAQWTQLEHALLHLVDSSMTRTSNDASGLASSVLQSQLPQTCAPPIAEIPPGCNIVLTAYARKSTGLEHAKFAGVLNNVVVRPKPRVRIVTPRVNTALARDLVRMCPSRVFGYRPLQTPVMESPAPQYAHNESYRDNPSRLMDLEDLVLDETRHIARTAPHTLKSTPHSNTPSSSDDTISLDNMCELVIEDADACTACGRCQSHADVASTVSVLVDDQHGTMGHVYAPLPQMDVDAWRQSQQRRRHNKTGATVAMDDDTEAPRAFGDYRVLVTEEMTRAWHSGYGLDDVHPNARYNPFATLLETVSPLHERSRNASHMNTGIGDAIPEPMYDEGEDATWILEFESCGQKPVLWCWLRAAQFLVSQTVDV